MVVDNAYVAVFWSFPSQRGAILQNRLDSAREARAASEKQLAELQTAIAAGRAARSTRYGTNSTRYGKENAN
ncbi:hypothetical protein BJV78DRAFT_1261732 [Lactifluus subvellereus]|nr:hypothetical protein BJV78DRAFT_1261732 [Lactifluus subvellereus]